MRGRPAVQALAVFLASRIYTTAALALVYLVATAAGWPFASYHAHPEFWQLFGGWDTSFLRRIATEGYPVELPTDAEGQVVPNAWAFLPLYPWLLAAIHAVLPVPLTAIGAVLSLVAGAGAAVVFRGFVAERVDAARALRATALFCFGPVTFVLQFAYTESLFLLLVFAFLWAVERQRYWLTLGLGVLAAFTRPGALALALLLAIELVRRRRTLRLGERVAILVSGAVVAAAGLSWSAIAALVTGRPDAYLATEHSWWHGFVGEAPFIPLAPWFQLAGIHLGVAGIALVVVAGAAWVFWLTRPSIRALGPVTMGFVASYSLYLFAVFLPQQSLFRIALPLSPLLASESFTRTRRRTGILLGVGAVLQLPALVLLWVIGYP